MIDVKKIYRKMLSIDSTANDYSSFYARRQNFITMFNGHDSSTNFLEFLIFFINYCRPKRTR